MATQAILSSVEAGRQLLGRRPFRSISTTRRTSFVVRATATPPAKVQHNLKVSVLSLKNHTISPYLNFLVLPLLFGFNNT